MFSSSHFDFKDLLKEVLRAFDEQHRGLGEATIAT